MKCFYSIYLSFFLKIDSEKRTHNFFNLIEVENIILLHTIIFIQKISMSPKDCWQTNNLEYFQ